MLKFCAECPIRGRLAFAAALAALAWTLAPSPSQAFPATTGAGANEVLGQPDFQTGFVDFEEDPFFGAEYPSEKRFFGARDVAFDTAADRLFVADLHNARVLVFDLSDGIPDDDELAATFVLGQPDFDIGGADPDEPFGNKNTQSPEKGCGTETNACGIGRAWALDYDAGSERLFMVDPDNNRVLVWELSNGIQNGMPATHVLGQPEFQSGSANTSCDGEDGVVDGCAMDFPHDVHYDANLERLFVVDSGNHRVLIYDLINGIDDGMSASGVLGQHTLSSNEAGAACGGGASSGDTSACGLTRPSGLAYDAVSSRLFVGDSDASRVLQYDLSLLFPTGSPAIHVLGQQDFTTAQPNTGCGGETSGPSNTNACGLGLYSLALEYDGDRDRLFTGDAANHRILTYDTSSISDGEPAHSALGQPDLRTGYDPEISGLGGATERNRLMNVVGLAYDPIRSRLFAADVGNHRVVAFGANLGGVPIDIDGGDLVGVTENADGTLTVDMVHADGTLTSLTLPEGTEPADGQDAIQLNLAQSDHPTHPNSQLAIEASMPEGETKSVSVELGEGDPNEVVCIRDRSDPHFVGGECTEDDADKITDLPDAGTCETVSVRGDPGDNPDDPDDPEGWHDIELCMSENNSMIHMHGLLHTGILLDRSPETAPAPPGDSDESDAPAEPAESSGDEAPYVRAGGCASAASSNGQAALFVAFAILALALRRRRRL